MTGPADTAVKAPATPLRHGVNITELWPVSVWLGQLDSASLGSAGEGLAELPVAGEMPFASHVQACALSACGHDAESGWSWNCTVQTWSPGFFVGASHSGGDVRAVVILSSNVDDEHPDSGVLSIHDPRDGAGNVALPGLPWGRPLKFPGRRGMALAVPGWLRWSVAPLRAPHTMTVWTATASRIPSKEGR